MSDYPKVHHVIELDAVHVDYSDHVGTAVSKKYARLLATRLVAVVGCEQLDATDTSARSAVRLADALDAERKRAAELLDLLKALEWCSEGKPVFVHCPACGGICPDDTIAVYDLSRYPRYHVGHAPNCRLRAALEGR